MAAWSASLPQVFLIDGYQEKWPDNLLIQPMDVGPPKLRRRQTAAPEYINCVQHLTTAQVATLRTYYITTITNGSTVIDDLPHPRTGADVSARMIQPPTITPLGGDNWRAAYLFEILP